MKKQSWIILSVCALLLGALVFWYVFSQNGPERITQPEAVAMVQQMERAFERKNSNEILEFIAPTSDTKISNITPDQLHGLLARYFRSSDKLSADMTNYSFVKADETNAMLEFDLAVHNDGPDSRKQDYSGHITLHLKRVEVPHLLGLYRTREWRIAGAETTGPELSTFGD